VFRCIAQLAAASSWHCQALLTIDRYDACRLRHNVRFLPTALFKLAAAGKRRGALFRTTCVRLVARAEAFLACSTFIRCFSNRALPPPPRIAAAVLAKRSDCLLARVGLFDTSASTQR